jgi:hypothetical protein
MSMQPEMIFLAINSELKPGAVLLPIFPVLEITGCLSSDTPGY